MLGTPTRFLTGTDEHSVNIAEQAAERGSAAAGLRRRERGPLPRRRGRPRHRARPVHPDDRPRPRRGRPGDGPPGARQRRHLSRHLRGLVLPERGLPQRHRRPGDGPRHDLPEPPRRAAPVADRAELVLPAVGLPGAPRAALRRAPGLRPARLPAQRDARVHPRQGLEDFSISREDAGGWGIPFPIAENGETAQREDGSWDPEAGTIYVWYDALINYITGAGFPDDPAAFERWWPADLHVIGKDIARFHTIYWPAMLWSAGLEAPRRVWVHGWLLAPGRADEQEPRQLPRPATTWSPRSAPTGRATSRCARSPSTATPTSSWDSFVRRYNADLANDFGNLVNRTVSMAGRYLDGERPGAAPARRVPLGDAWSRRPASATASGSRAACSTMRWRPLGVRRRRRTRPSTPSSRGSSPRPPRPATRGRGAAGAVLGDLIEACRLVGLAAAPFMPGIAPRVLAQLGHAYPYGPDGNGGPPILDELAWGAHAGEPGRRRDPEPLFPRLEPEARRDRRRPPRRSDRRAPTDRRQPCGSSTATATSTPTGSRRTSTRSSAAARPAGVERLLVPGWNVASSSGRLALADRFPWLDAAVGVHPHDAAEVDDAGWAGIVALAGDPRVVGHRRDRARLRPRLLAARRPAREPPAQPRAGRATPASRPILHCRLGRGARDAQDAPRRRAPVGVRGEAARRGFGDRPPAIIHSFSGPVDYAGAVLDLGLAISFSGLVFRAGRGAERRGGRGSSRPIGSWSRPMPRSCRRRVRRAGGTPRNGWRSPPSGWPSSGPRTPRRSAPASSPPTTGSCHETRGASRASSGHDDSTIPAYGDRARQRPPDRDLRRRLHGELRPGLVRSVRPAGRRDALGQRSRCHGHAQRQPGAGQSVRRAGRSARRRGRRARREPARSPGPAVSPATRSPTRRSRRRPAERA